MRWMILLFALVILFVLTRKTRRPSPERSFTDAAADELASRLAKAAERAGGRGSFRIPDGRRTLSDIEKSISFLNALPDEELLPVSRRLCENGRFLQETAADMIQAAKDIPPLPAAQHKQTRLEVFAQELISCCDGVICEKQLAEAIDAWQTALPMKESELRALPVILQKTLFSRAQHLAAECADIQRARQAAHRAVQFAQHDRSRQAERLYKRFGSHSSFRERLHELDSQNEWLVSTLEADGVTPEKLAQREHARQMKLSLQISNILSSLHLLRRLPWKRLLEEWSTIHHFFQNDPVYRGMDQESREGYRLRAAALARHARLEEKEIASAILSLSQSAKTEFVQAHVGYYLLDDGLPMLLKQLPNSSRVLDIYVYAQKNPIFICRVAGWICVILLLTGGWYAGLSPFFLPPFAFAFAHFAQNAVFRILHRHSMRFLPRMQIDRLTEHTQTLVVCTATLSSGKDALKAVKHLSILHEACRDEHLHFLLLADFQDSLTATLTSDDEIMSSASSAVSALCEASRHTFFYFQRERSYSPSEKLHIGRERRQGAVHTLLRLIEGEPIEDAFACATADPYSLKNQYRYVILLDDGVMLPPSSACHLVGAMLHPLAARQKENHHMRGVSMIQPRMEASAHSLLTPLSSLLAYSPSDVPWEGFENGVIAPKSYLESVEQKLPEGLLLNAGLPAGELGGCAAAHEIILYAPVPQTLKALLKSLYRRTRANWQLLPLLLHSAFPRYSSAAKNLNTDGRFKMRKAIASTLLAPACIVLLAYGAGSGRIWLWLATLLLCGDLGVFSCPRKAFPVFLCRLGLLPLTAFVQLCASLEALYRLFFSRQRLLSCESADHLKRPEVKPPLIHFAAGMGGAVFFVLLCLLPNACWFCCLAPTVLWALTAVLIPFLAQERNAAPRPTAYMRKVLLQLAKRTQTFFEIAASEEDHGLAAEQVQIDPNRGIVHETSPRSIGLYLCSQIAAQRLGLVTAAETAARIQECAQTLENLPKWKGLFYQLYDTLTLSALHPKRISSADCGILAVCLLSCAQGIRVLLPELSHEYAELSSRLDALACAMQLHLLYDKDAELFYTDFDPETGLFSSEHCEMLASESRLLSFAAIMLGQVPLRHWYRLDRSKTRSHALLSMNGSMQEYLLPLLFQPLVPNTLLHASGLAALRRQRRRKLKKAYGISDSAYYAFDTELKYRTQSFGLQEMALNPDVQDDVLAPYASVLSLPVTLKKAFRNLLQLQVLGLEGPLGFFEAADFDPVRTQEQGMRIVRMHTTQHQAMILCAICNTLKNNYLASLFSVLPRAQAFQALLDEPLNYRQSPIRQPLKHRRSQHTPESEVMQRNAHPLCFPIDAHILHGAGTTWMIDAQGGGFLSHGSTLLTCFSESCHVPSGIRLYLRDSHSGAYWLATDPHLMRSVRFETAQAVFEHSRFDVSCELRMWVDPLSGSAVHCLTLENNAVIPRTLEICSYLEPALHSAKTDQEASCEKSLCTRTERLGKTGISLQTNERSTTRLWHLFQTDGEFALMRFQNDKSVFLGRGHSFLSPRALEHAISAMADRWGESADPCMSIRVQFSLAANGKRTFFFITRMAQPHEKPSLLTDRFPDSEAIARTYDSAHMRGLVSARFAGVSVSEQEELSRMTGALCYQGQPFQGGQTALTSSTLMDFGLEQDQPILMLECKGSVNKPLVQLVCKGCSLWKLNGLKVQAVIVLLSHTQAAHLREEAEEALLSCTCRDESLIHMIEQPHEELLLLLRSAARLHLHGSAPVTEQMNTLFRSVRSEKLFSTPPDSQRKTQLPEAEGTMFYNGFGGFTKEGDYQISLSPGMHTPAPWRNPLCTEQFGTMACESGLMFSWHKSIALNHSHNEDDSNETFFLRDTQNRLIWSLTPKPLGNGTNMRITHAPGETVYESSVYGVHARMTCFTDSGYPMGIRMIQLKNEDEQPRRLTLMHTSVFSCGVNLKAGSGCVTGYAPDWDGWPGLYAIDSSSVESAAMSAGAFQGLWNAAPFVPTSLETLPNENGRAAVLSFSVPLAPGESRTFASAIVFFRSQEEAGEALDALRTQGVSQRRLLVRQVWENRLSVLQFDLPDPALSLLLGRWLPYQVWCARLMQTHMRISPLHLLKNGMALINADSTLLRDDLLHWAQEPLPAKLYDRLFLPFAAAVYAQTTGNSELFAQDISDGNTLIGHCVQIIEDVSYGAHGLPLANEEEESVPSGMFLCEVIRLLAPFCAKETEQRLLAQRENLLSALDRFAWDGAWYLQGWRENGNPIGGSKPECQITLFSQALGVISGASRDRCVCAMENVYRLLFDRSTGVLRLGVPPYNECGHLSSVCQAIRAFQQLGQETRAWEMVQCILPAARSSTRQLALRYRAEPYAAADSIFSDAQLRGRGCLKWTCATSASDFTSVLYQLLGLRIHGNVLRFTPVVPQSWDRLRITYRYGSSTYHLHASRDCTCAAVDGKALENGSLPLVDDKKIHEAFFPLR